MNGRYKEKHEAVRLQPGWADKHMQINKLMILEHCDECKSNEMRRIRGTQGKQTQPKCWETLGMVWKGFMEEVTIELNFNGESDLKRGKAIQIYGIIGVFK